MNEAQPEGLEPVPKDQRLSTQFRLYPELHRQLREYAEAMDLPLNFVVGKLLEEALARAIPAEEFTLTRRPTT